MSGEVLENDCVKVDRGDAKYFPTFYASVSVVNAAEVWKTKSVSIVSPKSGRVLKINKTKPTHKDSDNNVGRKSEKSGFFSKIFVERKSKVSDFEYQQSKVRQDSAYKPFWATKVANTKDKDSEPGVIVKKTSLQESYAPNVNLFKWSSSPKATIKKHNDVNKIGLTKKLSTVDRHAIHRLKMPPFYNGSNMFMSNGEQIFWV